MARRLPVYFLLDTSGSMYGEPIQSLDNALREMINILRSDAQAVDTVYLSVITFDREIREIVPMTELPAFQLPEIVCPQSGPTFTGKALEILCQKVESDVRTGTKEQLGDWRPLLFIFTDGKPSDIKLYNDIIPVVKSLNFAVIIGCAAGLNADINQLNLLCDEVFKLADTDSAALMKFFVYVSSIIEQKSKNIGGSSA